MPLSRPGSTFSLPFYKKKVYSGVNGAHFQSQGHLFDATCYAFIFSSQLRVHEEKPDFLSDRNPQAHWQGEADSGRVSAIKTVGG